MKLFDRDDYRYSFFDGMCANVYGTLTTGVFLTGFALYLKMSDVMIGLMMAVPAIVTLFQLPCSYYLCRKGQRKTVAFVGANISRLMWLPMLAVGLMPLGQGTRCLLVLAFFLVSQAFSSVSYIAWISWTSDLVPDEIRGAFFGTRNMLCGAAGIAAVMIFGNLVDIFQNRSGPSVLVFAVPFGCAVVFGLLSACFLNRIPDVPVPPFVSGGLLQELCGPFKENNFRKYLLFAGSWNFSVYLAGPFFSLYYLRDLNYSYGFVALLTTAAALVDLLAMRFWGSVSDTIKNKAVIQLTGWGAVFLPALWVAVRPQDVLVPVILQIISGACWAGVALCTGNLLLRISPQQGRVWFISAYSITAGLGAALAPVVGGIALSILDHGAPQSNPGVIMPLHYLFFASTALRMLSLLLLRTVREPQEKNIRQALGLYSDRIRTGLGAKRKPLVSTPASLSRATERP